MYSEMMMGLYGTVIVWILSASIALVLGIVFAAGLLSNLPVVRLISTSIVNVSRGVPTSLYIILGGLLVIKGPPSISLPAIFPGTLDGFAPIAWAISIALAFGSSGHLAEIFVAAYKSLGESKLSQMSAIGVNSFQKFLISVGECSHIALPATSTRMIHHLHNTAFAGLFPVVELFGSIQNSASSSFKIFEVTLIGCAMYIVLSGFIWMVFRILESVLSPNKVAFVWIGSTRS